MVVIVTERLYIVSQKIHTMYVEEGFEEIMFRGKTIQVPVTTIKVQFEPINTNPSNRDGNFAVEVKVYSRKKAIGLFKDMVNQVREQCPDQVYLDKIAENFLTGVIEDDRSASEICVTGEEKRRNKKVLRRPKKRGGSRGKGKRSR
jgi:hypothetical protein